MHAENLLYLFVAVPAVTFVISILLPPANERLFSVLSYTTIGAHMVLAQLFILMWIISGTEPLTYKEISLFRSGSYEFFLDFYFDRVTAVYLFVGSILTFLVTLYSRTYLHREPGYKRFFNTIHFFYLGFNIVILSGNLETLFTGWEILGISSFLLIAFYRDRYLPVKNAMKVFSVYRIGDVGIIIAMWLSHHLWHENITFFKLNNYVLVHDHLQVHSTIGIFISVMILISAMAKSAQVPFSSWLPRAMEGPTPSSAIFYGSLSVHLGVFLLMRTYSFWEHQIVVRIMIGLVGISTALIATGIARVQSSIKSQIAYASASQIGVIFVEMSLGLETLALIHFAGNAFLRTYQLLVSPSVVTYLIREQFYHFSPREASLEQSIPRKIRNTFYVLCMQEWHLDTFMQQWLWAPVKKLAQAIKFISLRDLMMIQAPVFLMGTLLLSLTTYIPQWLSSFLPVTLSIFALSFVLKSFVEREHAWLAWIAVVISHLWIALAISYNEHFTNIHLIYYLSGIAFSGVLGLICIAALKRKSLPSDLSRFHGSARRNPVLAFIFLLASLGVAGFPVTPSFIGEDLLFTHIEEDQYMLAFFVGLNLIIDGIAIIRIYAKLFLGPGDEVLSSTY